MMTLNNKEKQIGKNTKRDEKKKEKTLLSSVGKKKRTGKLECL